MGLIDRSALAELQVSVSQLRSRCPTSWRPLAADQVRLWLAEHMPELPNPEVHIRILEDVESGRCHARASITIRPLWMDVQLSEAAEP